MIREWSIRARRGMTLLEVLVAMALMGMMAVIVSTLWGQLRSWNEEADRAGAALRPHRAAVMLREQWGARHSVGDEDETLGRVQAGPGGVSFLTTRPVLYPSWPVVEASYSIERRADGEQSLVYDERRVGPTGEVLDAPPGAREAESLVVLERCAEASWSYRLLATWDEGGEEASEYRWSPEVAGGPLEEIELVCVRWSALVDTGRAEREEVVWAGALGASR